VKISRQTPSILAAAFAICVFCVTLAGGFAYDFYGIVRNDQRLTFPRQWGTYWTDTYNSGIDNLYRPLTSTIFGVQSWLSGIDESHAWRFHLASLLMHAGVSALVAELARRLTNSRVALIAGLLYAVHPIHTEVICDIVGQAEMLCALGSVGAMVVFLRRPMTNLRVLAIFALFTLALLSKEQGMLLPLLLLCLWLCLRFGASESIENSAEEKNALKVLVLVLCWSLGAYVFVREHFIAKFWWDRSFLDPAINPMKFSLGADRWLMPLVLLGHYTQLLFIPWKLAPDYSGLAIGWHVRMDDPYLCMGIFSLIAWFVLFAIAIYRRNSVMLFCLLGIAITYGLIGNIVTIIGTNFAERLMYLPSVFFVILISMGLARVPTRALIPMMTVILALAIVRSFTYARRWNDRLALYEQAVRDEPGAVRMYMALATEYLERGRVDKAIESAAKARDLMPQYPRIWIYSAAVEIKANNLDAAQKFLDKANSLEPSPASIAVEQELAEKRAATQPSH
jgi:hypothetical protein